jgi:protein TonB
MFEDSTFESAGRIRTKSKYWMIVTFITNGSIMLLLILIPLIYPEALPKAALAMALVAPPPPPAPPAPPPPAVKAVAPVKSEMMNNQLIAPRQIPKDILRVAEKEAPPASFGVAGISDLGGSSNNMMGNIFGGSATVKAAAPKKVTISAGVAVGMLLQKTTPTYPPIAKAARVSGTVVLQATISKTGTIENLHVISGPAMLQQAALDAVKQWRYKPYQLNNEPVEVETTVNVIFTLGG